MKYNLLQASRFGWSSLPVISLVLVLLAGCTALREAANLRNVEFRINRLTETRLAGVDVSNVESYEDLSSRDVLQLGAALADGTLPLSFVLHLRALNPADNNENARLARMEWTLLLDEKETVSGTYEGDVLLRPGEPTDVPVQMDLDLVRFFDENLREFVDLVTALSGEGPPQGVKLRVQPTINTRFGRLKYPSPITVVSEEVGGQREP